MLPLPTLRTPRLELRQRTTDDLEDLVAMNGDPEVMRYIGDGEPHDPAAHRAELVDRVTRNYGPGLGYWSIFPLIGPRRFLGWVCLARLPGYPEVELGYRLPRPAWGRGYATEAATVLVEYAFGRLGLDELVAVVAPGNVASFRVLEKLGFANDGWREVYGKRLAFLRLGRDPGLAPALHAGSGAA